MNVARSPLRYPGGKQKLTPFIEEVILENNLTGCDYAEPYAGGAGVAINLLVSGMVNKIHLNDSCKLVFSFWKSVLDHPEELCRHISRASLNIEEWKRHREIIRSSNKYSTLELGFSFFYLNRCNRSGICHAGVIGGLGQKGDWKMDARFRRNDLICRIEAIAIRKKSVIVRNLDAENYIASYISKLPDQTLVYCDPPYYKKADRLYPNHYLPSDHLRLARFIQKNLRHPWLVSYDAAPEIIQYYSKRKSLLYNLQYNALRAYKGTEIFVFSDKVEIPSSSRLPFIQAALAS